MFQLGAVMELYNDRDWMHEQYWVKGNSHQQIADILGRDRRFIQKKMKKLGIPTRSTSEATKLRISDPEVRDRYITAITDPSHGANISAALSTPESKAKRSASSNALWADPEHRAKHLATMNTSECKAKMSAASITLWGSPEYIAKHVEISTALWDDQEYVAKATAHLDDPEYKAKLSAIMTEICNTPEYRATHSATMAAICASPIYRSKISAAVIARWNDPELRAQHSALVTALWNSPEYRAKHAAAIADPELKAKLSAASTALWDNPEFRTKMCAIAATRWDDPEYRAKILLALANQPKVSKPQAELYNILDELGVKYFREYNDAPDDPETRIGYWPWDCVIPRYHLQKPTLIIEVQGDWIHGPDNPQKISSDKSKTTYIAKYYPGVYELKYIWES